MTWWSEWREVYFELMKLACPVNEWEGKCDIYTDGTHSFKKREVYSNGNEIEEQLWAIRQGLA